MYEPSELSLSEIHAYFVLNGYKVTNTQLVKFFRKFLTGKNNAEEARKQFKSYVNTLATIKTENNEKYLILRRKYYDEVPSEDMTFNMGSTSSSTSLMSLPTEISDSPIRRLPPVYRAPPQVDSFSYYPPPAMSSPSPPVMQMPTMMGTSSANSLQQHIPPSMTTIGLPILEPQTTTKEQYKECVNEFQHVMTNFMETRGGNGMDKVDVASRKNSFEQIIEEQASQSPSLPPRKGRIDHRGISRENSIEQQQHNDSNREENKENSQNIMTSPTAEVADTEEDKITVKEAMLKFNRFASEEEAEKLIPSPLSKSVKNKTEKLEESDSNENLSTHPKSKEWLISAARADYQELAKLGHEYPQLVRIQDPNTGYNALHWASKHGNENVVKLIAGTFRCDVNCQTNGGYTALHIAMQFGRNDIFELLCNVYKADRDIMDWSGKKSLDYQKQMTNMSASFTFNKVKSRKKISAEKDTSFLRIGSLRHFLGGSNSVKGNYIRSSMPTASLDIDNVHKGYGSASSLPQLSEEMGPPKNLVKKRKQKRDQSECQSMPTTPNLENRSLRNSDPGGSDSDTAYGFSNNWGN